MFRYQRCRLKWVREPYTSRSWLKSKTDIPCFFWLGTRSHNCGFFRRKMTVLISLQPCSSNLQECADTSRRLQTALQISPARVCVWNWERSWIITPQLPRIPWRRRSAYTSHSIHFKVFKHLRVMSSKYNIEKVLERSDILCPSVARLWRREQALIWWSQGN